MNSYRVYILRCVDDSFYTGVTNNIERRVFEHNANLISGCYTASRLPVTLVYTQEFSNIHDAIAFEKQVKRWSRAKKNALIKGNITELKLLAKSHGSSRLTMTS